MKPWYASLILKNLSANFPYRKGSDAVDEGDHAAEDELVPNVAVLTIEGERCKSGLTLTAGAESTGTMREKTPSAEMEKKSGCSIGEGC